MIVLTSTGDRHWGSSLRCEDERNTWSNSMHLSYNRSLSVSDEAIV